MINMGKIVSLVNSNRKMAMSRKIYCVFDNMSLKYAWNGCSSLTIDMKPNLLSIWILSFSHLTKSNHIDNPLTIDQRFNFDILVLVV